MIIDMDYKNEIGHLLQKYFSGTIMPDEQRLLDSWMKEKEEHKQLFERLRKDTRFAEEYGIFREVDTTRAWEAFRVKNGLGRQRRMTTWIKYAAVIALPLLVAGVWLLFFVEVSNNTGGSKYENHETGGESCFGGLLVEVK